MKFKLQLCLAVISLSPLIVTAIDTEKKGEQSDVIQEPLFKEREYWQQQAKQNKAVETDSKGQDMPTRESDLIKVNTGKAKRSTGLREGEQRYLERIGNKYSNKSSNPASSKDSVEISRMSEEIKKIHLDACQEALKKIDQLSVEVDGLERGAISFGMPAKPTKDNEKTKSVRTSLEDRRTTENRIKHIRTQIKRYKIQAKEYCPRKYLRESRYFSKKK